MCLATTLNRTRVNSFLGKLRYPLDHDDLVHEAQIQDAPPDLLQALEQLPLGDFNSQEEVEELLKQQGYNID